MALWACSTPIERRVSGGVPSPHHHPLSPRRGNPFFSVDPAPAMGAADIPALREALLDTSRSLFERYRALFALRNMNTAESTLALVDGLGDESALFRHEIGAWALRA